MRTVVYRVLSVLAVVALMTVGQTPAPTSLARGGTPISTFITLAVTPTSAPVGSLVTLHVTYNGIGLVHTTVVATPSDTITFEPDRSMPCKYDQDATACTVFTFRANTPGEVTIHASANGEIYDTDCSCWNFVVVNDDAPAILIITSNRVFLPTVQR